MPVGESKATITASTGSSKQSLSLKFLICQECDAAKQRVEKVEGKRAGLGCLVGLPIGIAGYFIYHFLTGRATISWFGLLLGWIIAYVAIYLLFGKRLAKDRIDPHDQEVSDKVKSAVKLTGFNEAHAWTDGSVTFQFENASYASAFQSANFAKITQTSV
jgi:hypothetical protein